MIYKTIPELINDIERSETQVERLTNLLSKCNSLTVENISRDIAFFNAQILGLKQQLKNKMLNRPVSSNNLVLISKANNHNDKTCVLLTVKLQELESQEIPTLILVRFSPEEYKKEVAAQKQRQADIEKINHVIIDFMAANRANNELLNETRELQLEVVQTGVGDIVLHKIK